MPTPTIKDVLWANIVTLMQREWGGENQRRLAREAGIGPGGATRLKEPETSVRIEMLERVAQVFNVEAWQLVAPKLGEHLYVLDVLDDEPRLTPVYRPPPNGTPRGVLRKTAATRPPDCKSE